jgi:putative membrane protein
MSEQNGNRPPPNGGPGKSLSSAPVSTADAGAGAGTGIRKIISGVKSVLSLGRRKTDESAAPTGDVNTTLAHQRTDLALDRNYMAADRTLMAWIRTALAMISFGFTIGKLGQVMQSVEVPGFFGNTRMMSVEGIAYFLTILGTLSLLGAAFQYWNRVRELRAMGLRRQVSISFIVSLLLSAVGGFALSSLILAL